MCRSSGASAQAHKECASVQCASAATDGRTRANSARTHTTYKNTTHTKAPLLSAAARPTAPTLWGIACELYAGCVLFITCWTTPRFPAFSQRRRPLCMRVRADDGKVGSQEILYIRKRNTEVSRIGYVDADFCDETNCQTVNKTAGFLYLRRQD